MAITIAQLSTTVGGTGTAIPAVFSTGTTAGNGIVVMLAMNGTPSSVTDNIGNTYVQRQFINQFGIISAIYDCLNPLGGVTTVTVNFAGSQTVDAIKCAEVLGTISANAGNTRGANAATQTPNAITTTIADTIAFVTVKTSNAPTLPAGFNNIDNATSFRYSYAVFTGIQTSLTPTWTVSVGNQFAAAVEAYSSSNTGSPPLQFYPPTIRRKLFLAGPWPFGLPFIPATRIDPPAVTPPSPVPPVVSPIPSMMPLFLRLALFRRVPVPPGLTGTVAPTPTPPTPGPGHGKNKPYFRRLSDMTDERRIREIHDKISACLNSLIDKGQLRFQGANQWQLVAVAHTETRNPTTTDDVMQGFSNGSQWVNTVTKKLFFLADNSQNAAVWIGPVG